MTSSQQQETTERHYEAVCLWEELCFSQPPTNEELVNIIMLSPPPLCNFAWRKLREQEPTSLDLLLVILYANKPLSIAAWMLLKAKKPSRNDLLRIIIEAESLRKDAWEELLALGPTRFDLSIIMKKNVDKLSETAASLIFNEKPTKSDLLFILFSDLPMFLKNKAWYRLEKEGFTASDLRWIIKGNQLFRFNASSQLLSLSPSDDDLLVIVFHATGHWQELAWRSLSCPTNDQLVEIIIKVERLREEAWRRLLGRKPNWTQLVTVAEKVPSLAKRAARILERREKKDIMEDVLNFPA